ncbi:MAG: hypothetical protein P1P88_08290 [Bacteroidales bacterium]|nr:hypothetical protein [Bacteroidales bacterium]
MEDGTYFLLIKATSEKGSLKIATEKEVDGPCMIGNEDEPPDTKNKSVDVPVNAVFGPLMELQKIKRYLRRRQKTFHRDLKNRQ